MNEYLEAFYVSIVLLNKNICTINKDQNLSMEIDKDITRRTKLFFYDRVIITDENFHFYINSKYMTIFYDRFKNETNSIHIVEDSIGFSTAFYVSDKLENLIKQLSVIDDIFKEIAIPYM